MRIMKTEVMSIKEFLNPSPKVKKPLPTIPVFSFLPTITLKSLLPIGIDPTFTIFILASGGIVVLAFSEYLLAELGFTDISDVLESVFKFTFPVIGYGAILWFISTL